ncbi:MAG: glycerophosphodiester phosphodiesterase [Candidatus Hodarchaeota archaeon]
MLFIGHRGTRCDYDENTIEAFEVALKYGAEFIEFDIRKLKDGNLIVFHDLMLNRTIKIPGILKDFAYPEIRDLKTKIRNCQIPLLSEVFDILKGKVKFLIELKDEGIVDDLLKIVIDYELINDCIFSGRNLSELKIIKNKLPESQVCYNITKGKDLSISKFLKLANSNELIFKPDLINLKSNLIDSRFIQTCHKNNIMVLSWDFLNYSNPVEKIKSIIKIGVDGILFDDYKNISVIKEWLKKINI